MTKTAQLLPLCVVIIFIFSGCQAKKEMRLTEIAEKDLPKTILTYVGENCGQNGVYLLSYPDVADDYLFLNDYNVVSGEKTSFFSNVKSEYKSGTLTINIEEKQTTNYSHPYMSQVVYKINTTDDYKTIRILKNGKQIALEKVGK